MMQRTMLASAVVASALLLTGCQAGDDATDYDAVGKDEKTAGTADDKDDAGHAQELAAAQPRIVTTYDGGNLTLDATTLDVIDDTKLEGFNRLNPVGDGDHTHSFAADPQLTDTEEPHHGVAAKLADGSMLRTVGTEDERSGAQVVDDSGKEIASSDDCPGVHGEAAAKDEVIALGCEDGILLYKDGKFEKIDAPNSFGRIGNQSGSDESQYILGASYSFRSLGRGPEGEGVVLTTDGTLKIIDPATASVTAGNPPRK
ncbi:MAG: hypothetical protein ACTIIH_11410 [Brevibacterium sp.]|uniref:hypothetical protein n=1 Tax=Brevibacterium sp. TaxID=1701 RepID=UPI003F8EE8DF